MATMVLEQEFAAYESLRNELESSRNGKWALVHGSELIGTYDSFEQAANDAVQRFGRGPYLITQIGAPPVTLPASVMFNTGHATDRVRF